MFHKHNWVKIKETYCPPTGAPMMSATQGDWDRYAFGITTILWECSGCHDTKKVEILGKGRK